MAHKKTILVKSKILGLLVNMLTTDYEYSRRNRENVPLLIQRIVSKIEFFFLILYSNFGLHIKFETF